MRQVYTFISKLNWKRSLQLFSQSHHVLKLFPSKLIKITHRIFFQSWYGQIGEKCIEMGIAGNIKCHSLDISATQEFFEMGRSQIKWKWRLCHFTPPCVGICAVQLLYACSAASTHAVHLVLECKSSLHHCVFWFLEQLWTIIFHSRRPAMQA